MRWDLRSRPEASAWANDLSADHAIGFGRRRHVDPELLTASQATEHTFRSVWRFESTRPGESEPVSRFYRLHPAGLSRTLRAGTGRDRGSFTAGRPLHPEHPRVITVREGARLQALPDWFGLHATKWHGFRQVGSCSPPPVARAVAEAIMSAGGYVAQSERLGPLECDDSLLYLGMTAAARRVGAVDLPEPRRCGTGTRPRPRVGKRPRPQQLTLDVAG
jgi:DNA (cytosine-5)-methyltransferase 1